MNESYKHNVKGKKQTQKNTDCVVPFTFLKKNNIISFRNTHLGDKTTARSHYSH